jgi:RimJ/RimL family protein N-acetyltransferase
MGARPITDDDFETLRSWRNEDRVRIQSFRTEVISEQEHRDWYARKKLDASFRQFILDGVGTFSLSMIEENTAVIGYFTATGQQPGAGTILMQEALAIAWQLGVKTIVADIIDGNTRSIGLVRKFRFEAGERGESDGKWYVRYKKVLT